MGKAKFFLGAEGQGANMKLVVNAIMGAMMASFAEGMSLADEVGLVRLGQLLAVGTVQVVAFTTPCQQIPCAKPSNQPRYQCCFCRM